MSTALILGPLQSSSAVLPLFDARVPAGFPSPALDHMEHKLSLDALLDLQAINPAIKYTKSCRVGDTWMPEIRTDSLGA